MPTEVQTRLAAIRVLPHAFMRAVVTADPKDVRISKRGGKTVIAVPSEGGVSRAVLNASNLPERIEAPINHPLLGKTTVVATYSDFRDWDGYDVVFPGRLTYTLGGRPWMDLTVSKHAVGGYMVFPIPANLRTAATR